MSTSEKLRDKYAYLWHSLFHHPFVVGIGDGSLPMEKFQFYIRQDYLFLVQYSRVLAIATAKAQDLRDMERFAHLMNETTQTEMELHRSLCHRFGIPRDELESTQPTPVTRAYADYLLRVAYEGSITDIIATILPCQWGYYETGLHLARTGDISPDNPYVDWIDLYSTEEFGSLVGWLRDLLDERTKDPDETELRRLEDQFLTATRYEFLFWDMAYNLQDWPL